MPVLDREMAENLRKHLRYIQVVENIPATVISRGIRGNDYWFSTYLSQKQAPILDGKTLAQVKKYFGQPLKELIQPPPLVIPRLSSKQRKRATKLLERKREAQGLSKAVLSLECGYHESAWAVAVQGSQGVEAGTIWRACDTLGIDFELFLQEVINGD